MATKRMFSNNVIEDDDFMMLSKDAQLLYFHMGMATDDDGFTKKYRTTMRSLGIDNEILDELVQQGFVYVFESNVALIRAFKINNDLKNDRYHETIYQQEFNQVEEIDKKYYLINTNQEDENSNMDTNWIQDGYKMETEHNITQHSLAKLSTTERSEAEHKQSEAKDSVAERRVSSHKIDKLEEAPNNHNKIISDEEIYSLMPMVIEAWNCIEELDPISEEDKDRIYNLMNAYGYDSVMTVISNISESRRLRGLEGGNPINFEDLAGTTFRNIELGNDNVLEMCS